MEHGKNRFFNICEAYQGMLGSSDSVARDARRYQMVNESLEGYGWQNALDGWCNSHKNKFCIAVNDGSGLLSGDGKGDYGIFDVSVFEKKPEDVSFGSKWLEDELSSIMLFDSENDAHRFLSLDFPWEERSKELRNFKPIRLGSAIGGRYGVGESASAAKSGRRMVNEASIGSEDIGNLATPVENRGMAFGTKGDDAVYLWWSHINGDDTDLLRYKVSHNGVPDRYVSVIRLPPDEMEDEFRKLILHYRSRGYDMMEMEDIVKFGELVKEHFENMPTVTIDLEISSRGHGVFFGANYSDSIVERDINTAVNKLVEILRQYRMNGHRWRYTHLDDGEPGFMTDWDGRRYHPERTAEIRMPGSTKAERREVFNALKTIGKVSIVESCDDFGDEDFSDDYDDSVSPEINLVRSDAESAKARGEYYLIGYPYTGDEFAEFLYSSKSKEDAIAYAKEELENGEWDCINVCDPEGYIVKNFENNYGEEFGESVQQKRLNRMMVLESEPQRIFGHNYKDDNGTVYVCILKNSRASYGYRSTLHPEDGMTYNMTVHYFDPNSSSRIHKGKPYPQIVSFRLSENNEEYKKSKEELMLNGIANPSWRDIMENFIKNDFTRKYGNSIKYINDFDVFQLMFSSVGYSGKIYTEDEAREIIRADKEDEESDDYEEYKRISNRDAAYREQFLRSIEAGGSDPYGDAEYAASMY